MSATFADRTRLLIVDDDPRVTELVVQVLEIHDWEYSIATNGEQALEAAEILAPAMIFMSVSIPNQDGWLVCYKLKTKRRPPRIVLTTHRLDEGAKRFADFVSADAILRKPLSSADSAKTVLELIRIHIS